MTLHVDVANKIATYRKRDGHIVCGNSGYKIKFTFDSEWDEHESKTARFIWRGQFFDVDFTGDTCDVPIVKNTNEVQIGVYAGDLSTTTAAVIGCKRSILCEGATPSTENDKSYANEAKEAADRAEEAAERAEEAAGGGSVETDPTLAIAGAAADAKATGDRLTEVENTLANLTYKPIGITSFTLTPQKQSGSSQVNAGNPVEIGTKVNFVKFNWTLDRAAHKAVLTSSASNFGTQDVTSGATSGSYQRSFTAGLASDTSFTLTVTDKKADGTTKNTTSTKTISFLRRVYVGAAVAPATYDSAFVLGLPKKDADKPLRATYLPSFDVEAGAGEYIYYCLPVSMGKRTFTVGVLPGGFDLVATITLTNETGNTAANTQYYIYRSNNANLGAKTVTVS